MLLGFARQMRLCAPTATLNPALCLSTSWRFERFIDCAHVLIDSGHPFVIAGNYNVVLMD
jgi:hypothetical protein